MSSSTTGETATALMAVIAMWVCVVAFSGSSITDSNRSKIAYGWVVAGLANGAIGFCQFFEVAAYFEPLMNISENGMVYGNLRQANHFASLMNIALISVIILFLGKRSIVYLIVGSLAAVFLVSMNALSASRTGLLQLLVVVCLLMFWNKWDIKNPRQILVIALIPIYFLASALMPWLAGTPEYILRTADRVLGEAPECSSRLTLWSNVLDLVAEKPWLGWGWGQLDYAHFAHLYRGERFCDILDNAHNLPLHLAVELGIPLATIFFIFVCWIIIRIKPWQEKNSTRQIAWGVLSMIGLHSFVEYPLWYGPFQMAVALCIGMLLPSSKANPSDPEVKPALAKVPVVAVFSLAACGYALWDYHRISQLYLHPDERAVRYRENTAAKVSNSWLFRQQVEFADLTLTPVTFDNATEQLAVSQRLLSYSPEPRIIIKVIESARLLGRQDVALWHLSRLSAAFPSDASDWVGRNVQPPATSKIETR